MAQITINEISDNYTFNTGNGAFATVALPITAAWGPAYVDYTTVGASGVSDVLEDTKWLHFPATQEGLESFVATYRGPVSNYKIANDYSYQIAMTYLAAGYDVLTCRVSPGTKAQGGFVLGTGETGNSLSLIAKYPGSFGNNIMANLTKMSYKEGNDSKYFYNLIIYVTDDSTGAMTAVENLSFTFGYNNADIPTLDELKSNFVTFEMLIPIEDGKDVISAATIRLGTPPSGSSELFVKGTDVLAGGVNPDATPTPANYYVVVLTKPTDWDDATTPSYSTYYKKSGNAYTACTAASDWVNGGIFKKFTAANLAVANQYYGNELAAIRYTSRYGLIDGSTTYDYRLGAGYSGTVQYLAAWSATTITDETKLNALFHMEWVYNAAFMVIQILKDKLNYNPNRLMVPWDDQNIALINGGTQFNAVDQMSGGVATNGAVVSPLHKIIMDTAFASRCATGMIDLPKSLPRSLVYNTSTLGYVQMLSKETLPTGETSNNLPLYDTNSAVFGPWASYRLVSMQKMVSVPPSFLALLIHRAQVLNQAAQYEWILPTNRKHNLKIGEPDYTVSTKLLNIWQKLDGVGVNVIAKIPDLGTNVWGNSTLFDVPPATYQALANLSTRWLVNAVEDVVYRCGIAITFQYNNEQAYSKFYAGVSPILDTMINVGAIEDYKIKMSADINGLDQVNSNTVLGKIWITINGVVNDIIVDLIALPQGTSLAAFGE